MHTCIPVQNIQQCLCVSVCAHAQWVRTLGDRDHVILNVYAPNNLWKQFYGDLSTRLIKYPLIPHVVGGDFNSSSHMTDDRSMPQ